MALFIDDISTAKIMIRWSSDAFLACIRPKVLEWTNNMSREMISVDSFFDINMNHHTTPKDPRIRANKYNTPFSGPSSRDPQAPPESLDCSTACWKTISGEAF
jgi:hypothetical protein